MEFNHFGFLIMEKSSASRNQHLVELSSWVQFIFIRFHVEGIRDMFSRIHDMCSSRFWYFFQLQYESTNPKTRIENNQNFESVSRQTRKEDESVSRVEVDKDDESLSREEVEMVMRELKLFCSQEDRELSQKIVSSDLSRLFDEQEPSVEEVKEAFDVFDENKDGFIDAEELRRVLCLLGMKEGSKLENCTKMIERYDQNKDGKIDFSEFVKFMENSFNES